MDSPLIRSGWQFPHVPHTTAGGLGEIAIVYPAGTPISVVAHFSGHDGEAWFAEGTAALRDNYYAQLLAANCIVVEVRYKGGGWFFAQNGHVDGFAKLAGRPATAMRSDTLQHRSAARDSNELVGISGGSAQIAYALAFYEHRRSD